MDKKINSETDMAMLQSIVDELNQRYNPKGAYEELLQTECKPFEFEYYGENWKITFVGFPVYVSDETDSLTEENRWKISMLSRVGAENTMRYLITVFANSGASEKNKIEWVEILKKGLETE